MVKDMIRRDVGRDYYLITQDDHARLSGQLAARLGNERFDRPEPFESVTRAISLHDCGWPTHDERPTLDVRRRPTDVFESPPTISLAAWSGSTDGAVRADPYAGLLVSLHGLALSARLASSESKDGKLSASSSIRRVFELNKFQHRQIEIQETLRRQLGMRTDQPLTLGLVPDSEEPAEMTLSRNFHLLQAMDLLSLSLCCTQPPARRTVALQFSSNQPSVTLSVRRHGNDLCVHPWPFDGAAIECEVPYRAVAAGACVDEETFQRAYAAAEPRILKLQVWEG